MPKNQIARRVIYSLLLGLLLGVAISEIPFIYLRETARPPKEITLVIPKGTSEQVARGEQPPSIPENMLFVVGDTLIVKNEDKVDHKLGPLWIPANTSAQLPLATEDSFAFECSFQPGKYLGIDVHQPLTIGTRIYGSIYAGLPLGILFALYSFVLPTKKKENAPA